MFDNEDLTFLTERFDNIRNDLHDHSKSIDKRLNETCERLTAIETKIADRLDTSKEKTDKKYQYMAITSTIGVGILAMIQALFK